MATTFANVEIRADGRIHAMGADGLRKFEVVAYNGGELSVAKYHQPVVIDLAGLSYGKSIVANLHHDQTRIVGHVTEIRNDGRSLRLAGHVSGAGAAASEFLEAADNGFPWQASVEALPSKIVEIAAGKTVQVNGRTFTGPILVARKSKLYGFAFLPRGADEDTSVVLATNRTNHQGTPMEVFNNIDPSVDPILAERQRLARIQAMCRDVTFVSDTGDGSSSFRAELNDLRTQAINGQLSERDLEASVLALQRRDLNVAKIRGDRPQGPSIRASTVDLNAEVIEAALYREAGLPGIEKHYRPDVLESLDRGRLRGFGLQAALLMAAQSNGLMIRAGEKITTGNIREVLAYAMPGPGPAIHGGFSTVSLPGIFSNVANKSLLVGWTEEDQTWREIAHIKPVSDFKQVTSYRLLDNMEYEELGPAGEIKHGKLDEESYTRQVKTYAKMFSLTREAIINDDLGAFEDLRTRIGRGAGRKFNRLFWAKFLNNATFFTTERANYIEGATTNLGTDGVGLELAILAFRALRSADGKRIGGKPEVLLVPPELEFNARRLYQSVTVNTGGAATATAVPNDNIHGGLYRPVVCDWLSDTDFTGASATAWYLFRSPMIGAPVVVSFLNGIETPTVESADADFNTLGIQFRGYHDFGVDLAEYLAGVKSKGAA